MAITNAERQTAYRWHHLQSSDAMPSSCTRSAVSAKRALERLTADCGVITEADLRAARILSPQRVGEDVCDGIAIVPTR
jgi:hypothetical protein